MWGKRGSGKRTSISTAGFANAFIVADGFVSAETTGITYTACGGTRVIAVYGFGAADKLSLLEGRVGFHGGVVPSLEKVCGGGSGSEKEGEAEEIHGCVFG